MTTAVIVDAVRTAGGKRNGKLRNWHAVDLASEALKALQERNSLDPSLVDDVIMGCVMQVSEQALNIGRNAVLAAGWPESVPATTIDRQCGSSQQALHFAAQGVMAGAYDVVVAAGVESMTRTPMGSSVVRELGYPFGPRMMARYAEKGGLVSQGIGAEMIADQWGISREELDAFSVRSHQRAARATAEGRFENEIIPVAIRDDEGNDTDEQLTADEGIRPDSTVETLAKLKPAFKPEGGKITAGNSSQITDGASAVLIMSEEKASELGLRPRARFHAFALAGVDPITMLTGPIPATTTVLERAKLTLDDIDCGRDQRGLRLGRAGLGEGAPPRTWRWSTPTAAPSPSGTRSVPREASSWPRCSTSWSGPTVATGCSPCARAAGWPTPPSSSGWAELPVPRSRVGAYRVSGTGWPSGSRRRSAPARPRVPRVSRGRRRVGGPGS